MVIVWHFLSLTVYLLYMKEVNAPTTPIGRTNGRVQDKEPIRGGKPRAGRKYVLHSGTVSPVLSPLFSYLSAEFVGALSYGACVDLNRAFSCALADKVEAIGGAYGRDEHLMWSLLLSKSVMGELYRELLPWVQIEAPDIKHNTTFYRAIRYVMLFYLSDHALTYDEVRVATQTKSVFITISSLRRAGLLERAAGIRENGVIRPTFILTKKGKTFVGLTCDILQRKENSLRAVLITKD